MQGSVRGYLLTEDAKFLEPYESASAALPAAIDRLAALVADNSGQQASMEQVRSKLDRLVDRYRRCWRRPSATAATPRSSSSAGAAARS